MLLRKLTALAAVLVVGTFTLSAQAAEKMRFAVTDVEGLEKLQVEWGPFKEALTKATGLEWEFFPVNNRTAAAEALKFKKVDFVLTGPAEYVVMNKRTNAYPVAGFGRPDYFCAIVVMADSGITSVQQLKGKKVAFKDVGSTSGHLCPMQLLADYGIDPRNDIQYVHTSRNLMHEALKRGDVAALGENYRSWVAKARDKDTLPPGAFRVIARSGDLPNDVLMVGAHVDNAVVAKVKAAIDDHHDALIASILTNEENMKYKGMKFLTSIKDEDYNQVRAMYATIGYPKYADFVGN